jgi:hypothetical protein
VLKCPICGYETAYITSLEQHLKLDHGIGYLIEPKAGNTVRTLSGEVYDTRPSLDYVNYGKTKNI